jgi:hypothetical protein
MLSPFSAKVHSNIQHECPMSKFEDEDEDEDEKEGRGDRI